ncbi:UDP-glucuronate 4-epimerase 3-like [Ananas comosus]|uniref:UDP-glucuronate 4-epimerase n=1 Tax=Ananas comosus TaxID=4615 RepID=A0A6P5FE82_ANACO|nr:UDP-glucuronate 4-epimerase 3-like [Ananas comosus]
MKPIISSHLDAPPPMASSSSSSSSAAAAASSSCSAGGGGGNPKPKPEKPPYNHPYHRLLPRWHHHHHHVPSLSKLSIWSFFALALFLALFLLSPKPHAPSSSSSSSSAAREERRRSLRAAAAAGAWERSVRASAAPRRGAPGGLSVLVTGAAGFVGCHAAAALRRRGDGVVGLDSFNDYYDPSLKRARAALLWRAGVFVVEGDINDAPLLRKVFDAAPFSHVLHLAAQAGVRHALKNPSSYVASNVNGLVSLLEACRSADPQPAVVWASSSSVYGLNTRTPFSESDRTDRPASLYAATKKAGEEIAHVYNHIYGLSITGLRFFTVYGPWGRPDMAYFSFTRDILRGKPITVFEGPGHATVARDFTYIDDIVRGCLAAVDTAGKSTGSRGKKRGPAPLRVYNLGNTAPVPVAELVTILERLLKAKAIRKVVKMPRNGDVQFTHANISLAERELGYRPTTNLHTGLKKFVRWYLDYYGKKSGRHGGAGSISAS